MARIDGWRSAAVLVLVVVLVATTGCSGLLGQNGQGATTRPTATETPRETGGSTATAAPSSTPSASPTPTATTSSTPEPVDPANPFGERNLSVAIDDPTDREYRPIVRRALDYWEENSTEYAGYPVEFHFVAPSDDPRIRIEIQETDITCNRHVDPRTTGCAPLNVDAAPDVSEVQIASGYSDHYTDEIVAHELGHTLGIAHGEQPTDLMARTHPSGLAREQVRVYITDESGSVSYLARTEVITALEYYETHPELNESERLDWVEVDSAARADLIVEGGDGGECFATGSGSCSVDAPYEDQQKMVLDGIDSNLYAWHTAALLAPVFLDDEIPEVLTSDSSRAERERWSG